MTTSDSSRSEKHTTERLFRAVANLSLWAMRDAKMAEGHYPVRIYAPSDSSIARENADLCEYLASHGNVVLASPSMGVSTRDMTDDLAGIDSQALDISFLVTYSEKLPDTDSSRIAVMSFSWGGISSLFAASRDSRIQVLMVLLCQPKARSVIVSGQGLGPTHASLRSATAIMIATSNSSFHQEEQDALRSL